MSKLKKYWLFSILLILAASAYPLYMGIRVVSDMIREGSVLAENYPKYIIPYTPISIAIIVAILIMPFLVKMAKKFAFFIGAAVSIGVFFAAELLLESKVIVATAITTTLEDWQMFMCYVPPEGYPTRTWTEVDVLIGDYSPAFKMHFYLISVILIIAIINSIYGYAQMINSGNKSRMKALNVQSVCTTLFLGLCILACFTAFFRTGEILVSALSASLMCAFFILFGITVGIFVSSFLLGKSKLFSIIIPAILASITTLLMYIGEMILLSGNLYQLGTGLFFESIPKIVLAPIDLGVVILSGCITAVICKFFLHSNRKNV